MIDIKWIRENSEKFDDLLKTRGLKPQSKQILALDYERRSIMTLRQKLQHVKKEKSKNIIKIKNTNPKLFEEAKKDSDHISYKLEELKNELENTAILNDILNNIPNLPDSDVPIGKDEQTNILVRKHDTSTLNKAQNNHHADILLKSELIDFENTSNISGSRFVTLHRDISRLERALINFMLDNNTESGFQEVSIPFLVNENAMYNVGQLPKFSEDSFKTTNGFRLIPTAEVPLTNFVAKKTLLHESLPLRYTTISPCFRSEAGSAGKDTKGIIRMHQFNKVELVSITEPDESRNEHEYILSTAENILKKLGLPYRIMLLSTGDMGFAANKTYDVEVWMPNQKAYREISSCSNCGDFQARRMQAKYKPISGDKSAFVHTLNGSALPLGRTIAAITENFYEDNKIIIPEALVNYMNGQKTINLEEKTN